METKHTPGPWRSKKKDGFSGVSIIENKSGQMRIALVHNYDSDQQTYANANLIAAAPDMIKSLLDIRKWYEENLSKLNGETPIVFSEALSVIFKATS